MKQVAQNYRPVTCSVLDVPAPHCQPGGVLVRSAVLADLDRHRDDEGRRGEALAARQGARPPRSGSSRSSTPARQVGPGRRPTSAPSPGSTRTRRSATRSAVSSSTSAQGADEFSVGQLVACAGNEHALHAEVNWVPANLCVPVPDGVAPKHAAFATVGAIAMHGVRRAEVQLGETACVIGLGLVGQLIVQLLVASGVRVVGVDVVDERCRLAESVGRARVPPRPTATASNASRSSSRVCSHGLGADHVFIAAGGTSNDAGASSRRASHATAPGSSTSGSAASISRGTTTTTRSSTSASRARTGPGATTTATSSTASTIRPATSAGRNGAISRASSIWSTRDLLDVESLVSDTFPDRRRTRGLRAAWRPAPWTASASCSSTRRPLATRHRVVQFPSTRHRPVHRVRAVARTGRPLRVGFIGAGNYASSMLLPHLASAAGRRRSCTSRRGRSLSAVERATPVRLRARVDRRRCGPRRRRRRCRVHRDPSSLARRAHVCGPRARQGRVRREAARAVASTSSTSVLDAVTATGQRPAHGRLQSTLRAAARGPEATLRCGRQFGTARYVVNAGRLAPVELVRGRSTRARASSVRAATSSTR